MYKISVGKQDYNNEAEIEKESTSIIRELLLISNLTHSMSSQSIPN